MLRHPEVRAASAASLEGLRRSGDWYRGERDGAGVPPGDGRPLSSVRDRRRLLAGSDLCGHPLIALLPDRARRVADFIGEALMGATALFMVVWGVRLVEVTWHNTIADFPALSVGLTYMPIPIGGAALLLFVLEHVTIGPPSEEAAEQPAPAPFD